jgi:aerobic carbon-monoxide dehydrogenase medium subunit
MYPSWFRYEAARCLDQATRLLRDGGDEAKVLAGGQSLIPMMKLRFASPELLVDINTIPGLDYHRVDPDTGARAAAEASGLMVGLQAAMMALRRVFRRFFVPYQAPNPS